MTVPNRQVRRTRARVLEAAHRLLAQEGPDAVTHLRVAEAADVARATVYRHWPDRIDLLVDLLESGASPPVFGAPPGEDARAQLITALGRASDNFEGELGRDAVGGLPTELVPHFFRSLSDSLGAAIHVSVSGENTHHMVESTVKGIALGIQNTG